MMTYQFILKRILMLISILSMTGQINIAVAAQALPTTQSELSSASTSSQRARQFWQDLQDSPWFTIGSAQAPSVYLIIDTSCHYCVKLLDQLSLPLKQQQLQVRVVLVGLLSEDSYLAAATILESAQPEALLMAFKNNPQSIKTPAATSPHLKKIDVNNALLIKWQLTATPLMVFKTKSNQIKVIEGLPQDMRAFLASLDE